MKDKKKLQLDSESFYKNIAIGNKKIEGRFVIPSGIRCTNASTIASIFASVPEIGIITTKSISASEKEGYKEPIYARYAKDFYINAVGLANPGAKKFAKEIEKIDIQANKFLLVSIFGGNIEEFSEAAAILENIADGFELNMSCPHAKGYGIEIGADRKLVAEIVKSITSLTEKPVIVKLSATCPDIEKTVKAAIDAGAVGISAINSLGPSMVYQGKTPLLSNRVGGLSGIGIRPMGLNTVRRIREAIGKKPLIIGMGGIITAEHIEEYFLSGADFFGVGSALTGMNTSNMKKYFTFLVSDLLHKSDRAEEFQKNSINVNMDYHKAILAKNIKVSEEHFKLQLEDPDNILEQTDSAGKFYFLSVPGRGEKPFALFSGKERAFIIRKIGAFTTYLSERAEGDIIYYRGPYGTSFSNFKRKKIYLIGGGTGTIPLLAIADKLIQENEVRFIFGYRNVGEIFEIEKFGKFGKLEIITEDGLSENKGLVTDLLTYDRFEKYNPDELIFINSGPEQMVKKCIEKEMKFTKKENIWGSITYMTSCGVGICGKCSTDSGLLSCIDGPFVKACGVSNI